MSLSSKLFFAALICLALAIDIRAEDGGGRDVSVVMFSTRTLHSVTVSAGGPDAWYSTCERCAHKPLANAIHLPLLSEVFAGGPVRVTDDGSRDQRTATGLWHLKVNRPQHDIDAVLTLPSERYVAAVLNAEASASEPAQSLRAMAVVVRTYALNGTHYHAQPGHLTAPLCDSTQCQALRFGRSSKAVEDAVFETAGETLWYRSARAEVFFSQDCGGQTEEAAAVWPTLARAVYLRSHADGYCLRRGHGAWHAEMPLGTLSEIASTEGWKLPLRIDQVRIAKRSTSGRALRIDMIGAGTTSSLAASALRFGVGRSIGWNTIRSDWYEMSLRDGLVIFDGKGRGHGVGLCQTGAAEMAAEGKSYRNIASFYFAGTTLGIRAGDNGWQQSAIGPLLVRSTAPVTIDLQEMLRREWDDAQMRFITSKKIVPHIVFAPTTEIFRQLTAKPGWALASASGNTIVLQPYAILTANGRDAGKTLVHEMLHVLVESQATDRAPLWLREGLVEVLEANSNINPPAQTSPSTIDEELRHAETLEASQRAHHLAANRVQVMINRYGLSSVRKWLSEGVPAGVL